ncbi:hypothetical protein GCM10022267_70890 [Lentzea roselyniae]|uniref:4-hydroxy-3-methylbut-2-enyl diphosphate reductase n=1 Tax=Lentzea roselyniae TaxID=531940 RepID=A0ABP7BYN6_9PSEU
MNRSVERRQLPVRGAVSGQLQVGPFVHPDRGLVRCPSAAALVASLRREGHHATSVSQPFAVNADAPNGVLFTASYLDRDDRAVGFCVAVHATDQAGHQAARDVVNTWSAVWRSRRAILAPVKQSCGGGDVGAKPNDAPCPHVVTARDDLKVFRQRGDQVIVIGKRGQDEVSVLACEQEGVILLEPGDEITSLHLDPHRVSYLVQPGVVIEDAAHVIAALRARYPRIRGSHPDAFCYAASDYAAAVRAVAASSDTVLVLGSASAESNEKSLQLAVPVCAQTHIVHRVDELRPAWLAGAACVGLVPTSPDSRDLGHQVLAVLSGLGPLSVVRRLITTEVLPGWSSGSALQSGRPVQQIVQLMCPTVRP